MCAASKAWQKHARMRNEGVDEGKRSAEMMNKGQVGI